MLGGDFNAYGKETPITTILDGGYVSVKDLGKVDPPEYSYVFDGQWGTLDYVFMRESFFADSRAEAATWAVNSDELDYLDYNLDFGRDPAVFDGTTPFRFSDHDPIVLNFQLEKGVTLAPTAEFDCEGHAVLAGSAITFTGTTISGGDVNKGTAIYGDLTSLVGGELLDTAFDIPLLGATILAYGVAAAAERAGSESFGPAIGGGIFTAGTWRSGTITMAAGTTVTLDGENDPNSVFLLQAATTMTVGADCTILLINEAKAENVLWSVGALTTGARTIMEGNIVASGAMTFGANNEITGSIVAGSAITFGADNDIGSCVISNSAITFGAANSVTVVQDSRALQEAAAPVELAEFQVNAGADSATDSAVLTTLSAHAFLVLSFTLAFAMFG
jgi:hypothetical protein